MSKPHKVKWVKYENHLRPQGERPFLARDINFGTRLAICITGQGNLDMHSRIHLDNIYEIAELDI